MRTKRRRRTMDVDVCMTIVVLVAKGRVRMKGNTTTTDRARGTWSHSLRRRAPGRRWYDDDARVNYGRIALGVCMGKLFAVMLDR
jgi:hypothetical protein